MEMPTLWQTIRLTWEDTEYAVTAHRECNSEDVIALITDALTLQPNRMSGGMARILFDAGVRIIQSTEYGNHVRFSA